MSIEVLPFGMRCNLGCTYCYEEAVRARPGGNGMTYDKAKLLEMLHQIKGESWILFGGEPLLVPLPDLEEMLKIGFDDHGITSVQTNGTLITDRHIELFVKYNTHIGISLDGPGELNDARWAGTLEGTRKATQRSLDAIKALAERSRATGNARLMPSFIVCLHALNLVDDRWPTLKAWFEHLDSIGVIHVQYHFLDLDHEASALHVDLEIILARIMELWELQGRLKRLRFKELDEIMDAQRGRQAGTCVWHACDPWNTRAVEGLNGDGTPTQCGRAGSNDGIDWVPAEGFGTPSVSRSSHFRGNRSHERQMSLYVTPQEDGGCKDCRFWLMCQAHCPGSAIPSEKDSQGDWRLRTTYCDVFKALFAEAERRTLAIGEVPVSLLPHRLEMEARLYRSWAAGQELYLGDLLRAPAGTTASCCETVDHGDQPHGDSHGDHTDEGMAR